MLLFNNSTFTKYILAEMYSDKKHINITDVPSQKGAMLFVFFRFLLLSNCRTISYRIFVKNEKMSIFNFLIATGQLQWQKKVMKTELPNSRARDFQISFLSSELSIRPGLESR